MSQRGAVHQEEHLAQVVLPLDNDLTSKSFIAFLIKLQLRYQYNLYLNQLQNVTHLSDVSLKSLDAIVPDDEPELQGPEPPAQWHLPMLEKVQLGFTSTIRVTQLNLSTDIRKIQFSSICFTMIRKIQLHKQC